MAKKLISDIERFWKHVQLRSIPRGHEFTPENTYTFRGGRQCRECQRMNWRIYEEKERQIS